ncbi:MAG: hypothetical protein AAFR02_06925 [Pseudomonadota bacterium]
MTSDFKRVNQPRIDKMLGILDVIERSSRSNKAYDEMMQMLEPVRQRLGLGGAPEGETEDTKQPTGMSRKRLDYSIACSKADRAIRACNTVAEELKRLKEALPDE